jgi:hypothetical protein
MTVADDPKERSRVVNLLHGADKSVQSLESYPLSSIRECAADFV